MLCLSLWPIPDPHVILCLHHVPGCLGLSNRQRDGLLVAKRQALCQLNSLIMAQVLRISHWCSQEAQALEAEQPEAAPEAENAQDQPEPSAQDQPGASPQKEPAAHEERGTAGEHAESKAAESARDESADDDDESPRSPESVSSWHGTPTWRDMTTFSQAWLFLCSLKPGTVLRGSPEVQQMLQPLYMNGRPLECSMQRHWPQSSLHTPLHAAP